MDAAYTAATRTMTRKISPDSLYRDAAHFPIQSRWLRSRGANCSPTRSCKHSLPDARLVLARDRIGKIQAVVHLYHALGG